jgi:hypothetical protein
MPVNGLLLTLTEDEILAHEVLLAVSERADIELGDRTGRWQPVVVETAGTRESHEVHEWLESLTGVDMVDVVFSSVCDPEDMTGDSDDKGASPDVVQKREKGKSDIHKKQHLT